MQRKGKNTLRNWAIESGVLLDTGQSISKQAIDGRLNDKYLIMMELIFKRVLNLKYSETKKKLECTDELKDVHTLFNRILLQDSTIQSLPPNLCDDFPASHLARDYLRGHSSQ